MGTCSHIGYMIQANCDDSSLMEFIYSEVPLVASTMRSSPHAGLGQLHLRLLNFKVSQLGPIP